MFIIDRFEEGWAIIESSGKVFFKLPRSIMPPAVKEGDSIELIVKSNKLATENRKTQSSELLENFFKE